MGMGSLHILCIIVMEQANQYPFQAEGGVLIITFAVRTVYKL